MAIQETILLDARWKLNANNHRKAHVPFAGLFRDVDSLPVQICLKRTMNIREPRFDEGGGSECKISRRAFFATRISQWISPHGVHRTDHEHPTTPIARVVF